MFNTKDGPSGIDLFTDAIEASGDPTTTQRETPNGRLVDRDAERTGFGVDRNESGQFASQSTAPTSQVRYDDGEVGADPYGVGNFGRFETRFETTEVGDRR